MINISPETMRTREERIVISKYKDGIEKLKSHRLYWIDRERFDESIK